MKVFVFLVSGLLKMDFSRKVFVFFWSQAYWKLIFQWESLFFLVSGLLKMDFSMRVFVFLVPGLLKIDFWWESLFFWPQALWKTALYPFFIWIFIVFKARIVTMKFLFFVWALLKMHFSMRVFFSNLRLIENCFFNESLCFSVSGAFKMFFEWQCLRFWSQALWKTVLCPFFIWIFKRFRTWIVFLMKVFVFMVSGLLKIDFSMKVFVFLNLGLLNFDFFNENIFLGFRPIKNWFFNESLGFFWSQAYWKLIF